MSLSLLLGSVLLAFWMHLGAFRWFQIALGSVTQFQTISLVLVVLLILIMSRIMKECGHMDRLVGSLTRLTRDARTVSSVMTALIGLLPMPGGALFSAPMVETSLSNHAVTREQKTLLNYWFRHIWEYWWPLYPGVVLAIALLEVNTWQYMAVMIPMTLFSVMAGMIFILRPIGRAKAPVAGALDWPGVRAFLWEIMPILIVVLVIIFLAGAAAVMNLLGLHVEFSGAVSILPGLAASIIWVCAVNRIPLRQFRSAVLDGGTLPLLFLLLAIMVFKGTMIESQAVVQVRDELIAYRIPVILVVMVIPFLSGFITGVAMGFVGTSFPLIIPMFPAAPVFDYLSFAALAYTFGYMGMMLSPVHLCLLVTKDYYQASLLKSYRPLIKLALTVMASTLGVFLILRAF